MLSEAPETYAGSFRLAARAGAVEPGLADRLAGSVGMRSILIHECIRIDLEIVAAATRTVSREYGEYVRQVSRWVAARA